VEPAGWWEHDRQASSPTAAGSRRSRHLRGSQPTISYPDRQGVSLQTFALTKKILEVESYRVDAGATPRPAGSVDPSRMV
jgi:hypothetical protein